jgi:hypothetical protein
MIKRKASPATQAPGPPPRCINCGKPLRRYRWRDTYPEKQWGGDGDGHVCGPTCGYRWAMMYLEKHPEYAAKLHIAMDAVMKGKTEK